jgi:hypothetical protein
MKCDSQAIAIPKQWHRQVAALRRPPARAIASLSTPVDEPAADDVLSTTTYLVAWSKSRTTGVAGYGASRVRVMLRNGEERYLRLRFDHSAESNVSPGVWSPEAGECGFVGVAALELAGTGQRQQTG